MGSDFRATGQLRMRAALVTANWCGWRRDLGGAEVGEEWATQDPNYGELLRVARAVEEARREIDLDALRDLIDPEHQMDAGDWLRFWEDRGFSGGSEASDEWVRAFADRAAKLLQKARRHVI